MNLFSTIEAVLAAIPDGWCTPRKAKTLAAAIISHRPRLAVEIGTYAGRSFFPIALAMKSINHGLVWGIDPYSAEISADGEGPETRDFWLNNDHARIERNFHAVIRELEIEKHIHIIKAASETVAPPEGIGFLHIDGQHYERAIDDADRFGRNVEIGGLCCLDDILWASGHVQRAADRLESLGFQELYRVTDQDPESGMGDDWAMFQRIEFA